MGCMGEFSHLFHHWSSFARVAWHPGLYFPLSETCINHHLKGIQRKLHQQCHPDMGRSAREINYVGKVPSLVICMDWATFWPCLYETYIDHHFPSRPYFPAWHCHRIYIYELKTVALWGNLFQPGSLYACQWSECTDTSGFISNLLQLILKRHLSTFCPCIFSGDCYWW